MQLLPIYAHQYVKFWAMRVMLLLFSHETTAPMTGLEMLQNTVLQIPNLGLKILYSNSINWVVSFNHLIMSSNFQVIL